MSVELTWKIKLIGVPWLVRAYRYGGGLQGDFKYGNHNMWSCMVVQCDDESYEPGYQKSEERFTIISNREPSLDTVLAGYREHIDLRITAFMRRDNIVAEERNVE